MLRKERGATSDAALISTVLGLLTSLAQHYEPRAASFSHAVIPEMGQFSRLAELQPPCLEECMG